MPIVNRRKIWAEWLQRFLEPGESVLALQAAQYPGGVEDRGRPDGPVSFDLIGGLDVPALNRAAETLVGGVTLVGPQGSQADLVAAAFAGGGDDLVLTERRVLVLASVGQDDSDRMVTELPRAQIHGLRHRSRLVQRGLLDLTFTDASVPTLLLGVPAVPSGSSPPGPPAAVALTPTERSGPSGSSGAGARYPRLRSFRGVHHVHRVHRGRWQRRPLSGGQHCAGRAVSAASRRFPARQKRLPKLLDMLVALGRAEQREGGGYGAAQ